MINSNKFKARTSPMGSQCSSNNHNIWCNTLFHSPFPKWHKWKPCSANSRSFSCSNNKLIKLNTTKCRWTSTNNKVWTQINFRIWMICKTINTSICHHKWCCSSLVCRPNRQLQTKWTTWLRTILLNIHSNSNCSSQSKCYASPIIKRIYKCNLRH